MHIRLFAIFLSALAIGFSYFGMNDRFALQNSETVRSRPEGWPKDKSIRAGFGVADDDGVCDLKNWPKSVECDSVWVDDTKKENLKSTVATIMPRQNWEIKQGINGKAQRTEKSTISYEDVQLPDDWKIPDLPTNSQIDDYLEHHKDDGKMDDWKLTCLRDEDDNEIGSRYKRIMREGQNIFDPHALDRELFVVPVRIYGDFKEGSKAAKKAVEDVCTISLIFPTTRRNDLYMFGCYQTSLASHRRAAKKAFGIKDNDDVGELHDRDFAKFIDAIKEYVDGYTTDATPAADSYLGEWLTEYTSGNAKTSGQDGFPQPVNIGTYRTILKSGSEHYSGDYLIDGCTESGREGAISHRHCTNNADAGATLATSVQDHAFLARKTWAKHVCSKTAGVTTTLEDKAGVTKIIYPIEFKFEDIQDSPLVLKTGKTHAEVNKFIECKHAENAKATHFNLLGGEGSCSIENIAHADRTKFIFRVRQPGIDLMDYFGYTNGKTSANTFDFMCDDYDGIAGNMAGDAAKQKGTHTATLSDTHYKTLFKFMELHVDAHMKHRKKTFQGTNIDVVRRHNAEVWGNAVAYNAQGVNSHADGYMWQPLGPNKMTVSDMCLSTMNTYHRHRTGVTKDDRKHNDLAPYQMLGGTTSVCHDDLGQQYGIDGECRGQYSTEEIDGAITAFVESFVYSRFATVDLPERQVFRAAQYGWWYRGDDMLNEKMHAMSTLGFHTDALTHDQDSCDSFVHPGSEHTPSQQRFFLEMSKKPSDYHPMVVGASANYPFSADYSMHKYGVQKGQLTPNDFANTLFTHADEGTTTDIKCQNTCKNIKATNGVILVAGALYLISVIGLLLPYDQNKGSANMQTKAFLLLFFVVTTCFTVSLLIHAGSLQRVQSGKLECTFHNDTGFFEGIDGVDIVDNTDTTLGYGLLLLWIGGGFSALCWFITLALVIAVMQGKEDTYISGVSVNEFFFSG